MIEKKYQSIFDVPVKSVDGQENFLKQFEGKILFFVNTTGQCGNASQWPRIDRILSDYKDRGVEVIYTPTNDYCGSVTFNEYENGISKGSLSADYAFKAYGIKDNFTELVSSRNQPWIKKNLEYDFELQTWNPDKIIKNLSLEQEPRSPLYEFLTPDPDTEILCGNFHKIITNRKGQPVAIFHNGTLGHQAYKNVPYVGTAEEEEVNLRKVLEEIIATDTCTDQRYAYRPYDDIQPSWIESDERIDGVVAR